MVIPLVIFLLLYLMMVTFFVLFSIVLLYHALRFGVATITNVATMGVYLVVSAMLLLASYIYISRIDWGQLIVIF